MSAPNPRADHTGPGTRTIMITTLAVVIATLALSVLVWRLLDRPIGELPGWIEAGATVAAVGAAIVAGFYAARAYGLEHQRERRYEDTQLSAQASLIAAWPGGSGFAGQDGRTFFRQVQATLRNASDLPVTDVSVNFHMILGNDHPDDGRLIATYRAEHLPPDTLLPIILDLRSSQDTRVWVPTGKQPRVVVDVTFRDTATIEWHRTMKGELLRVHH